MSDVARELLAVVTCYDDFIRGDGDERFGDIQFLRSGVQPFGEVAERGELFEQCRVGDSQQRRLAVDAAVVNGLFVGRRDLDLDPLFGGLPESNGVSNGFFYRRVTPPPRREPDRLFRSSLPKWITALRP